MHYGKHRRRKRKVGQVERIWSLKPAQAESSDTPYGKQNTNKKAVNVVICRNNK
jgi:hypothetical protein